MVIGSTGLSFEAILVSRAEHGLEGVVAKRWRSSYRSGERGWIKVKNRSYWRWELEREAAVKQSRVFAFNR